MKEFHLSSILAVTLISVRPPLTAVPRCIPPHTHASAFPWSLTCLYHERQVPGGSMQSCSHVTPLPPPSAPLNVFETEKKRSCCFLLHSSLCPSCDECSKCMCRHFFLLKKAHLLPPHDLLTQAFLLLLLHQHQQQQHH